jgi:hypothetical protein
MSTSRIYGPSGAPGAPAPGINTVAGSKSPAPLPATIVGNVTTEQVAQNPALTSTANPVALVVQIPSNSLLEQLPFEVSVSGYITAAAALSVTLNLYSGTSTTPGSNTLLKSSGAEAVAAAASFPFFIKATLIYDSVSGKLSGTAKFFVNGALVAEAAVTNTVTGVSGVANPVASFCVSATFTVANAANLVVIKDFSINE